MFKKLEERWNPVSIDTEDINKTQIKLLEMKTTSAGQLQIRLCRKKISELEVQQQKIPKMKHSGGGGERGEKFSRATVIYEMISSGLINV